MSASPERAGGAASAQDESEASLLAALAPERTIDLGEPERASETTASVEEYVDKRLSGVSERMDPGAVAGAVRDLAIGAEEGLFLLARVITGDLREHPVVTSVPGWQDGLVRSVAEAVERDLGRVPALVRAGVDLPDAGRELLVALAFSYGAGFPDDVWPVAAGALSESGASYEREDVFWALKALGRWVVEAGEGGRAAYRLAYQRLSEHFAPPASRPDEDAAREARAASLAGALAAYYRELLPRMAPEAHAYLWRYLWRHCADAGENGIAALRQIDAATDGALRVDVALALSALSARYGRVGRPFDALAPAEEAVALRRELAAANPAFVPDLASALNNLGIVYSELGRRQEALAPAEEAVALRRKLAAANPAFVPDLAGALNNLGARRREAGSAGGTDAEWIAALEAVSDPAAQAELLLYRSRARPAGDAAAIEDLVRAEVLAGELGGPLRFALHQYARQLRADDPAGFDAAWQQGTGDVSAWLRLPPDRLERLVEWIQTQTHEAERDHLRAHQVELLDSGADALLDEVALVLDPVALERYRGVIARARVEGVEAAYEGLIDPAES